MNDKVDYFVVGSEVIREVIWIFHRRKFQLSFVQDMALVGRTTEEAINLIYSCLDDKEMLDDFFEFLLDAERHYTR